MNSVEPKIQTHSVPPASNGGPGKRPNLLLWLALILILLGAGLAAGLFPRLRARDALRNETKELAIPNVNVVSPAPGKATAGLTLPAEIRPAIEAPVYARANGYVKRWFADLGAQVEAGQLLAEIDTPELNQELASARAEVSRNEAAVELAKTSAARWTELLKISSVSEQETIEKQADLKLKSAGLEAARSNLRRLEELQSFSRVTAPFSGTVTSRKIDVGDLISPNSNKELFRLADTRKLRVFVRVPQTASKMIEAGLMADLTIPEMPARRFPAKVVRTSGAIDSESRTLLTELEVDNSGNEILAGSYAQIVFSEIKQAATLVLPSDTLIFRADGTQVAVVSADGYVELRKVTFGRDFGRSIEVTSGVTTADRVISNPADSLETGAIVHVVGAGKSETTK